MDYGGEKMRLIDADALKLADFQDFSNTDVFAAIYAQPTVDAVPVVRCRECKYYKPKEYECGCDFAGGLPYVKADDFCSYGVWREADHDGKEN